MNPFEFVRLYHHEYFPTLPRVIGMDTDAIIAGWGVAQACMPPLDGESYIGMVIDMGDSCQLRPDRCWPLAYEGVVQPGLVCGNTPQRSARHASDARCVEPGEREPLQLNGGLVYMNLTTMRRIGFTERYTESVWQTARMLPSCLLYTSPSPRDGLLSRMPSSA